MDCASDNGSNARGQSGSVRAGLWFEPGLRFKCTQCGACCTGAPGFVWVGEQELRRIAEFLGLSRQEVMKRYVRRIRTRLSLRELPDGDCVFLERPSMRCGIYPVRPVQCRTWPFWRSNIRTPARWAATCAVCPGAGTGPLVPAEEIVRRAGMRCE